VKIRQLASSSSSRTKFEWSPFSASKISDSYASGIILSDDHVFRLNGIDPSQDTYFLISDIFCRKRNGSLHGEKGQDLKEVVLHDIANDAKLVEVATSAFSTEWLFESNLYVVDMTAIPCGTKEFITKS